MQSKTMSCMETITNTVVGMAVAWVVAMLVMPRFGYRVTGCDAFNMNLIFTIASMIRSYLLRRLFNLKEKTV